MIGLDKISSLVLKDPRYYFEAPRYARFSYLKLVAHRLGMIRLESGLLALSQRARLARDRFSSLELFYQCAKDLLVFWIKQPENWNHHTICDDSTDGSQDYPEWTQ